MSTFTSWQSELGTWCGGLGEVRTGDVRGMGFFIPQELADFGKHSRVVFQANHTWIKLGAKNHTNSHEITSRHQANRSKLGFAISNCCLPTVLCFFQSHFPREQQRSQQRVMNENENCWLTIHPINLSLKSNLSYSISLGGISHSWCFSCVAFHSRIWNLRMLTELKTAVNQLGNLSGLLLHLVQEEWHSA